MTYIRSKCPDRLRYIRRRGAGESESPLSPESQRCNVVRNAPGDPFSPSQTDFGGPNPQVQQFPSKPPPCPTRFCLHEPYHAACCQRCRRAHPSHFRDKDAISLVFHHFPNFQFFREARRSASARLCHSSVRSFPRRLNLLLYVYGFPFGIAWVLISLGELAK